MYTFDKLRLIRLTKNNRQILLDSNTGFIVNTTYNSNKGGAYKREDNTWIATDKEVHQFL